MQQRETKTRWDSVSRRMVEEVTEVQTVLVKSVEGSVQSVVWSSALR